MHVSANLLPLPPSSFSLICATDAEKTLGENSLCGKNVALYHDFPETASHTLWFSVTNHFEDKGTIFYFSTGASSDSICPPSGFQKILIIINNTLFQIEVFTRMAHAVQSICILTLFIIVLTSAMYRQWVNENSFHRNINTSLVFAFLSFRSSSL